MYRGGTIIQCAVMESQGTGRRPAEYRLPDHFIVVEALSAGALWARLCWPARRICLLHEVTGFLSTIRDDCLTLILNTI